VTTSDGVKLRVLEAGEGPPILLLHGITLSADIWRYQLAELTGHRVVALDQRGHGRSDSGELPLTLDLLAADVGEVIRQLDLAEVTLVGHSMGGMVALRFLASDLAASRQVRALALVATSADPVGGCGVPGAKRVVGVLRPVVDHSSWWTSRLPGGSLPGHDLALLLTRLAFGERPSPSQVIETEEITGAAPAKVTAALLVDILRFDELAASARIDLPTTVVVGTNDAVTPMRHALAMAEAIDGAELVVLPGCGHMVMLERHRELSDALMALAQHPLTGAPA
jgi:pimeloyl-ACP methyl ester carboxylesterase